MVISVFERVRTPRGGAGRNVARAGVAMNSPAAMVVIHHGQQSGLPHRPPPESVLAGNVADRRRRSTCQPARRPKVER